MMRAQDNVAVAEARRKWGTPALSTREMDRALQEAAERRLLRAAKLIAGFSGIALLVLLLVIGIYQGWLP